MSKPRWSSVVVSVLLTASVVAPAGAAGATPLTPAAIYNCGPLVHNWYDGWNWHNSGNWGSKASLIVQTASWCSTDGNHTNFTSAWVMSAADVGNGYAQAGHLAYVTYLPMQYSEWDANDGQGFHRLLIPFASNASYWYRVQYETGCGCMRTYYDNTLMASSSYGTLQHWSGLQNQYEGETTYQETDIPGTAAKPESLQAMQGMPAFTSNWVYPPSNNVFTPPPITSSRYCKSSTIYLASFQIWTC